MSLKGAGDASEGVSAGTEVEASAPLRLSLGQAARTVSTAPSNLHLLFAFSRHRLTVDVRKQPAPGLAVAANDECFARVGLGVEVLTACQSRLWSLACCPRIQ